MLYISIVYSAESLFRLAIHINETLNSGIENSDSRKGRPNHVIPIVLVILQVMIILKEHVEVVKVLFIL